MFFTKLIKTLRVEFAVCSLFGGPSLEIRKELEKKGWKFEKHTSPMILTGLDRGFIRGVDITIVISPENKLVDTDEMTRNAYQTALYEAAHRIYCL